MLLVMMLIAALLCFPAAAAAADLSPTRGSDWQHIHNRAGLPLIAYAAYDRALVFDPAAEAWGYYVGGRLIASGPASGGGDSCRLQTGSCRTPAGVYRVFSKRENTKVGRFMAFRRVVTVLPDGRRTGDELGFHSGTITWTNGCVHVEPTDLDYLFITVKKGTIVVVKPYSDEQESIHMS